MGTTRHIRQTGATTIKHNGKIVGNIGAGKSHVPTISKIPTHMLIQHIQTVDKKSVLTAESALTIYYMTNNQTVRERVNMLENVYYEYGLDDEEKLKFLDALIKPFYDKNLHHKEDKPSSRIFLADIASISTTPKNVLELFKSYSDKVPEEEQHTLDEFAYCANRNLTNRIWWRKILNKISDINDELSHKFLSTPKRELMTMTTVATTSTGVVMMEIGTTYPGVTTFATGIMVGTIARIIYLGGEKIHNYRQDKKYKQLYDGQQ